MRSSQTSWQHAISKMENDSNYKRKKTTKRFFIYISLYILNSLFGVTLIPGSAQLRQLEADEAVIKRVELTSHPNCLSLLYVYNHNTNTKLSTFYFLRTSAEYILFPGMYSNYI